MCWEIRPALGVRVSGFTLKPWSHSQIAAPQQYYIKLQIVTKSRPNAQDEPSTPAQVVRLHPMQAPRARLQPHFTSLILLV